MFLFKKKITFPQFVANLIKYQFDFIEQNFDKFVDLDDEYKVLKLKNRKDLYSLVDCLILADLNVGCIIHLTNKITSHDVGYVVGSTYVRFLSEYKKLDIKEVEDRSEKYLKFFDFFENFQEIRKNEIEERKRLGGHPVEIKNDAERLQADLCSAFAEYFMSKFPSDQKDVAREGRNFAAFKFAMAIVKADLIGTTLKEFSIDWS